MRGKTTVLEGGGTERLFRFSSPQQKERKPTWVREQDLPREAVQRFLSKQPVIGDIMPSKETASGNSPWNHSHKRQALADEPTAGSMLPPRKLQRAEETVKAPSPDLEAEVRRLRSELQARDVQMQKLLGQSQLVPDTTMGLTSGSAFHPENVSEEQPTSNSVFAAPSALLHDANYDRSSVARGQDMPTDLGAHFYHAARKAADI
ncbi:Uu.00g097600.m01.CDS01 [Anthostomella pinea]|uniref:Uu.00g097600.m01.CDS01 n=1 Tax=Anthostomella pinea TaxID=933095 RepID=A0AAI8YEY9_9PEZI|nr:Uu.00g097600.m01.CDS01 [Anthostomella pinea]